LQLLEPFGSRNPEPVFAAYNVRLATPPRILKEKHVKLRLASNPRPVDSDLDSGAELSDAAVRVTPNCHPDSAAIRRRSENREARTENWRKSVTYNALGWRMAERMEQAHLLPGDVMEIAFTLDHNDHPEFGGLELSLRDFKSEKKTTEDTEDTEEKKETAATTGS